MKEKLTKLERKIAAKEYELFLLEERPNEIRGTKIKTLYSKKAREFSYEEGLKLLLKMSIFERSHFSLDNFHYYLVKEAKKKDLNKKVISFITITCLTRYVRPMIRRELKDLGGWWCR